MANIFNLQPGTKKVFSVVIIITLGIIGSAWLKYRDINRSADPRVIEGRFLYKEYGNLKNTGKYDDAFAILDKIEAIYLKAPGYENSYEIGVIENDRSSYYLDKVETELLTNEANLIKENIALYLTFAREHCEKSISIHQQWLNSVGKLTQDQVVSLITPWFSKNDPAFKGYNYDKILKRRVKEIVDAQVETERRLSVSYSNMGIIERYEKNTEKSKECYEKALELWPENYVAKNNLRVLHGQPIEKRSIVKQLFPKDRIEKARENMKK
jgi:tetratricopeptide (TPR) repeat protein